MAAPEKPFTKDELETQKLLLEIQEMQRPFWKRPPYILAALPTLLIVITLLVGFLNGVLKSNVIRLYKEKQDLETQVKDFERQKKQLVEEIKEKQAELLQPKAALQPNGK